MRLNSNPEIGGRIRDLRLDQGMSQKRLSEILYVSQPCLSYWESGKHQAPLGLLVTVADTFGVTLDYLIAGRETHGRRVLIGGRA